MNTDANSHTVYTDAGHSSATEASDATDPAHGCCVALERWRLLAEKIESVLQQHSYDEDDMLASINSSDLTT